MVGSVLTYVATSTGSAQVAWRLMAEPQQWHRRAPHIRGASGLGEPEVEAGRRGSVVLVSGLRVPARITAKQDGHTWDWRVGPVDMRHEVVERANRCELRVELRGPALVELAVRAGYGPLIGVLMRNLARVAGEATAQAWPSTTGAPPVHVGVLSLPIEGVTRQRRFV
jgi:hypothetical protein